MTAPAYAHSPDPDRRYVVLRPAPRTEPPYDDDLPARRLRLVGAPSADQPLPFDQPLSFDDPGPRLLVEQPDFFDPQPTSRHELPPAREWLKRLLRVVLECLDGWRPPIQLRPY